MGPNTKGVGPNMLSKQSEAGQRTDGSPHSTAIPIAPEELQENQRREEEAEVKEVEEYRKQLYPLIERDGSFLEMAEKKEVVPLPHDLNAKWDACLDLTLRRFVYSSLAGAFSGLLFFRSPVTRWASIAFGAGLGIGSAYTDCNSLFEGSTAKLASPKITESHPS